MDVTFFEAVPHPGYHCLGGLAISSYYHVPNVNEMICVKEEYVAFFPLNFYGMTEGQDLDVMEVFG